MFAGRKRYLDDLASLWRKQTSSLVACRGRRRIGKSRLFAEFARRTADRCIELSGLPPRRGMTNADQLAAFSAGLAREKAEAERKAREHGGVQLWEGGPYWAGTNIGADKPEDYGLYFWWGDTVGYYRRKGLV